MCTTRASRSGTCTSPLRRAVTCSSPLLQQAHCSTPVGGRCAFTDKVMLIHWGPCCSLIGRALQKPAPTTAAAGGGWWRAVARRRGGGRQADHRPLHPCTPPPRGRDLRCRAGLIGAPAAARRPQAAPRVPLPAALKEIAAWPISFERAAITSAHLFICGGRPPRSKAGPSLPRTSRRPPRRHGPPAFFHCLPVKR